MGVALGNYWELQQSPNSLNFRVYPGEEMTVNNHKLDFTKLLSNYLRLDFDLETQIIKWRQNHSHFAQLTSNMKRSVRVLAQEPLENIISFICSQNNNIKR